MTKDERISVWKDTVEAVKEGQYEAENGEVVELTNQDEMVAQSVFYTQKCHPSVTEIDDDSEMHVSVENIDCLNAAEKLVNAGYKTCVLNMASFIRPGGGVTTGSGAQEEDIFRRTNIYQSLFRYSSSLADMYDLDEDGHQYPLERTYGAIYTPHVTVFRGTSGEKYKFLNKPFQIDVVSVSAIKRPQIVGDNDINEWAKGILKKKVCQMLDIAMAHGDEALVLGAFGCGAYATPPQPVAQIFKSVLSSERFRRAFNEVVFAVIDDANAYRSHNPNGNYKPFKQIIEG